MYQLALRLEGQLEGDVAKFGDQAIDMLFKAKERGDFKKMEERRREERLLVDARDSGSSSV